MVGASALGRGLTSTTGLTTETDPFRHLPLADIGGFVFGGHEVRCRTLLESGLDASGRGGFLPTELVESVRGELAAASSEVRPGTLIGASSAVRGLIGPDDTAVPDDATGREAVERLAGDIRSFQRRNKLDRVVVINLSSTEPFPECVPRNDAELDAALDEPGGGGLGPSTFYALMALEAGAGFINFTPSAGASPRAVAQRFIKAGLPHCGADGKTGETLVKTALAPMFAMRNLGVLSWTGRNLLGNRDGEVLNDPASRNAKLKTKTSQLEGILGYDPEQRVGIDFVRSLGDWKVAWDFIHFEGFLGVPMRMQFTWEGCDSILAAPLVLDLARWTALAMDRGEAGPLAHLAMYFKAPIECHEHNLVEQHRMLVDYTEGILSQTHWTATPA